MVAYAPHAKTGDYGRGLKKVRTRIGGKAAGMLLARAILRRNSPRWEELLEADDSFFVGSGVFCT